MIKYGVSPIAWTNDDLPSLGGETTLDACLSDIQEIGFDGVELGGKFPRDAAVLAPILKSYDLKLVGGWYSSNLLLRDAEAEIEALQAHLELLKALGCDVFIIAETSNATHTSRATPLEDQPIVVSEDWTMFCDRMSSVGDFIADQGLRLAYHHHLGTIVETGGDLDRFLQDTNDNVGLVLDTGHAAAGGIDAASAISKYPERIVHVHCKDIRQATLENTRVRGASFLDGVIEGMFTAPGDGDLDFTPVFEALKAIEYSGWIIVEAEQDPAKAPPKEYSTLGLKTLKKLSQKTLLGEG
jgi:inosose dehydratase